MNTNYRVSNAFVKLPDASLDGFTGGVIESFTDNPLFPTPPVTMADLGTQQLAFRDAVIAAADGGKLLTVAKKARRAELITMLRKLSSYVQCVTSQDLEGLLSSGFGAASTNRARAALAKPGILKLDNGLSTQLNLRITPVVNAKSFEVQLKNGVGAWALVGTFAYARSIILAGLTPGQTYSTQVRAVGGSLGYSDWSDPVSRIAT